MGREADADRRNRQEDLDAAGVGELVTWEEIKALMDRKLHVGEVTSLAGDGSKTPAVFSKRECARDIAEMVNRKFREVKR